MPRAFRVLCLHGMYQDARAFAAKTRHLSAACPELPLEFLYLDGPFTVVPPILARSAAASAAVATNAAASRARSAKRALHGAEARKKRAGEFRAWWRPLGVHQSDPREFERERALLLQFLRDKLRELGEVDGVMGFSQGASLAAWMCSEQGKRELGWTPKVAVLIGSYLGPPQYSVDASGVLAGIPSLHLFGSNDHVISASKSQRVADIFKQSALTDAHVETAAHNQGHVIPKGDAALTQFQRFLARNLLPADPLDASTASSPPSPPPTRHDAPPTQDARA